MNSRHGWIAALACAGLFVNIPLAGADVVVFQNTPNNGWFTPFNSGNAATVLYGDGGWLGTLEPSYTLTRIELGLVSQNGSADGVTDIKFTLNDGDPSGLVFGSGGALYSTTIEDVALTAGGAPNYFTLSIPLPNVATLGGFNNIGWSIGLENYSFDGDFGFQVSTASGQSTGFYTSNASFFDGNNWSLFAFSGDSEFGVANYVATIYATPEPATVGLVLLGAGLALGRRRR